MWSTENLSRQRSVDLTANHAMGERCGPQAGHTIRPEPVIDGASAAIQLQISGGEHAEPRGLQAGVWIARPSRDRLRPGPFASARTSTRPGTAVRGRPATSARPVFGTQRSCYIRARRQMRATDSLRSAALRDRAPV